MANLSAQIHNSSGADAYIDLASIMPHGETMANGWLSPDDIHYTKEGYRQMGVRIAPKLAAILVSPRTGVEPECVAAVVRPAGPDWCLRQH